MLSKQQRAERDLQQPWNANFDDDNQEATFPNKHTAYQPYSAMPSLETPKSPSFWGADHKDPKRNEPDREEHLRSTENLNEYQAMKKKLMREIAKQNDRIRGFVDHQKHQTETEEEDLDFKKNQIMSRLNKLKYGNTSSSMEMQTSNREPNPAGALHKPLHMLYEPSSRPLLMNNKLEVHRSQKHLKAKPSPDYNFNTKVMSEAVKQQEYEKRMKAFKSHDYMKDNKRLAKKVGNPNKKAFDVLQFGEKFPQHNTDSRNMIVEKVKNVDRLVELKAKREKHIGIAAGNKEEVETDYVSSIKMKMSLISKMVDLK